MRLKESIFAYGTSEGDKKAWDTRGRKAEYDDWMKSKPGNMNPNKNTKEPKVGGVIEYRANGDITRRVKVLAVDIPDHKGSKDKTFSASLISSSYHADKPGDRVWGYYRQIGVR